MLCCNDDNGVFSGTVGSVQLEDSETLNLENFWVDDDNNLTAETAFAVDPNHKWIKMGDCQIAIQGYCTWVGNIYWDCAIATLPEALKLLNYLIAERWDCTQAEEALYQRWEAAEPLTENDLARSLGLTEGVRS
jgi:hypothetical protein